MQPSNPHQHCLNCGAPVTGKFCVECGQKTALHHDSFWHMIGHFVADYFHYDGKFLNSLKKLIARPGYLTRMYLEGKRASYLQPVQLYIFISAVFFLVFFKVIHINIKETGPTGYHMDFSVGTPHEKAPDSVVFARYDSVGAYARRMREDMLYADTMAGNKHASLSSDYLNNLGFKYVTRYAWNRHLFTGSAIMESVTENFLHSIPKMFFFLMPLLALFLKFFFGRRKFFYADHAVMSLHFHSFLFISFMIATLAGFLRFDGNITSLIFFQVVPLLYFIIACRNFYRTSWIYASTMGLLTFGLYVFFIIVACFINLALVIRLG